MHAHAAGHLDDELVLPRHLRARCKLRIRAHRAQPLAEADVLRRVEDERQHLRLRQVLRSRGARGVGAGEEVLACVVVERDELREPVGCVAVDVVARGTQREDVRPRQERGDARIELHRVVLRALELGLVDVHRRGPVLAQEEPRLVVGDGAVHRGIGVGERHREEPRQVLAQLPHGARQEVALAARGASRDRHDGHRPLEHQLRDLQVAARARKPARPRAARVDRLARGREARRQKPDRVLRRQQPVAQEVGVRGDPQHLVGAEPVPAVRAEGAGLELP